MRSKKDVCFVNSQKPIIPVVHHSIIPSGVGADPQIFNSYHRQPHCQEVLHTQESSFSLHNDIKKAYDYRL